ncbi:MAG: SDR family NAD(P)-dependent oxidoreductase [Fusobacterium sp.]|uniref:SDR family oxidoreductase n=1 Tax=Fusobacterium sp. TaxID=68766 RepID=UPI0026DD47F7|nr:SDR family NAD(P)-dependent oxidoreductase [Fusobacterium sp.]MDO4690103.1 SDR family NAD(P)-dependent oxidoreductase [Fusobacterium sp.]
MKIALVTGATSGIGYEITKKLLNMNFKVYGLGRNFDKIKIDDVNFFKIKCDLSKLDSLEKTLHSLKKMNFNLIVHSAGLAYFSLHEEMNISKIKNMVSVNLQAPLIITQYFLRTLKVNRGTIINISSVTAKKESPYAAAYSATKAGLSHFGRSLFEEVRKYGVKVITLHLDMTKTNFYKNSFFECHEDENSYIKTSDVSKTLEFILNQDSNIVINELIIKPQRHIIKRKGNIRE